MRGILMKTLVGLMFAAPLSAAAFSWSDFWRKIEPLRDIEVQPLESEPETVVETNVSVSANSGGNSASGTNGSSGGTLTTGDASASASVTIQTSVGDDDFEDIRIEVETEGEPAVIERHVATSSGKVQVQTDVRVEVNATSSGNAVGARLESEGDDPIRGSEASSASNGVGDEDVSERTDKGDVFEDDTSREPESSARSESRLRNFFKRLFTRLFSFFGR